LPADSVDVYDAASWSVMTDLTEPSVAHRSRSEEFPDFTRGRWKAREPLGIVGADAQQAPGQVPHRSTGS
jgi:hypothetical protein